MLAVTRKFAWFDQWTSRFLSWVRLARAPEEAWGIRLGDQGASDLQERDSAQEGKATDPAHLGLCGLVQRVPQPLVKRHHPAYIQ